MNQIKELEVATKIFLAGCVHFKLSGAWLQPEASHT